MTDSTKRAVRLIRDFAHFPPTGITINWRMGQIIEDAATIALLSAINAPVEPIADAPSHSTSYRS